MDATAIIEALVTPEGRADPYPLYAAAHRLGPVAEAWPGVLVVSGYAEVNEVLRNPAFGHLDVDALAEVDPDTAAQPALAVIGRSVLDANPPDHNGPTRATTWSACWPRRSARTAAGCPGTSSSAT
ncbi:MAG TPA: hypothetical protein VGX23_14000 [Actinocrinis sp.]|nr:hypothetical protein [Actinocrinis sp.]